MSSTGETAAGARRPDLDGLRGVAVLLVVASHTRVAMFETGGAVGVAVFFALSGYLMTRLLLAERARAGRIRLGLFYARRTARLLPALVAFLVLFGLLAAALPWSDEYAGDSAWSLLYVANWRVLVDPGFTWELAHMWSLAVEEQFYLVWPLVVGAAATRRRLLRMVLLAGAASLALRFVLWDGSFESAQRVYFGTDTQAVSLMLGAALACLARVAVPRWVGWVALAGIFAAAGWSAVSPPAGGAVFPHIYAGLIASALTVLVIAAAPAVLTIRPLLWSGRVSYALYLWHPALAVLALRFGVGIFPGQLIALAVALAAAWASTRWLEEPVRRWARSQLDRRELHELAGARLQCEGAVVGAPLRTDGVRAGR